MASSPRTIGSDGTVEPSLEFVCRKGLGAGSGTFLEGEFTGQEHLKKCGSFLFVDSWEGVKGEPGEY